MNIGIICYPTFGGSGIVATELGCKLAERGHHIHFISYATPMRLDKFLDNVFYHEVDVPHYPLFEFNLYTLALTSKIIEVIKYEQLDIIHAHYAIPHAISGILTKNILKDTKIKLLTTLHGTDITLVGLEPAFHPIVKYSLENSDGITAVSNSLKNNTLQHFNIEKYKRINCPKIKNNLAPNGEKILMHVSNFRSVKRVKDTILILNEVIKQTPAKLVLIGDGPDRSDAENLTRELGLSEYVKFLGKQTVLVDLLSSADVFLLPSQSESFGLSALEAMSCGVPVVASNIGGIPEVVAHRESGYIAELGDVQRMAKYVVELLTNEKKWRAFSTNSRVIAETKFSDNLIIPQYEMYYEELLNR